MNITVGIVNDLRLAATALERIVKGTPGFTVAWIAVDGESAVEKHTAHPAEIVLMDLILPGMDGAETTAALMKVKACAILVVTATVVDNRGLVFAAMGKGALDAVNTPTGTTEEAAAELRKKLLTVSRLVTHAKTRQSSSQVFPPHSGRVASHSAGKALNVIGIGASTGGPQALATILRALPRELNAAVIVVQHLDKQFVPGLQRWLGQESQLPVRLAINGDKLKPGVVWLAHAAEHLIVTQSADGSLHLRYTAEPQESLHQPSVDVFFASLAALRSTHVCGVLLTGMGSDGAEGILRVRHAAGITFAQDEESCTVFGMPRAALEAGAVDATTPLSSIAEKLIAFAGTEQHVGPNAAETRHRVERTLAR